MEAAGSPGALGADGGPPPLHPGPERQRTPLYRRASCREARVEKPHAFERCGSLRALPSLPLRPARRGSLLTPTPGETGVAGPEGGACPTAPPSPRPDRGLFLNLTGALFGEGKLQQVLSPTRTGEAFFGKPASGLARSPSEKGRKTPSTPTRPGEDVFTQFSQYGSRAHLSQPEPEASGGRKSSVEHQRPFEHRRPSKPSVRPSGRGRERSCEAVVIRVTDTDGDQQGDQAPSGLVSPAHEPTTPTTEVLDIQAISISATPSRLPATQQPTELGSSQRPSPRLPEGSGRWVKRRAPQLPALQLGERHKPVLQLEAGRGISAKSDSDSGIEAGEAGCDGKIKQVDIQREYDLVQLIGEGWCSRVYLAERRSTREEVVLKAINSDLVTAEEFWREHQSSAQLWPHKHILHVYDTVFQSDGYFMFATEYAPLGDLTSNTTEAGLGEQHTKRVARQVGSALEWIHSKGLCHLDVKLDNILVFRSDFSLVKLCDFGSVRSAGDIVIKKNELLPYCPAELVARHANEYYQVDRVQDVFQFGIVVFFCLQGILPWQKADTTDPYFSEFCIWRRKRSGKVPRNFKAMTSRAQKLFRKILDPEPDKRLQLDELNKYMTDRWLRKEYRRPEARDGQSQLTLGSFQSVHSNAVEKNKMLYTLLQHGVETTVDRSLKNNRIMSWIKQGAERGDSPAITESETDEEPEDILKATEGSEEIDDIDSCCDEPRC